MEEAPRPNLDGDEVGSGCCGALCQQILVPIPLPPCRIFDVGFKGDGQLNQVNGGLAPNDHIRSAVCGSKGSREAVRLAREVHCDLLLGAGVTARELIEQFEDCIMTLVVSSTLEGNRTVVQGV